ncbi:PucR family transcriptional regulator [Nocardia sp. alder85J]|uniref:PucR family transcriptional regulator n=1 Tax=Nocardia sp. alder85J TaxID=2862949 RepID=UPI001CD68263|nr:helix-turn-helix domain-containing protein [Nocardia sp. alder85J]MCX4096746.1 helix-turn-helix domain-containing protein [Nocardia sp. alder85J]
MVVAQRSPAAGRGRDKAVRAGAPGRNRKPLIDARALAAVVAQRLITAHGGDHRYDEEIRRAVAACLEVAAAVLDGRDHADRVTAIEQCAARCAHNEIPLPVVVRCVHTGMQVVLDEIGRADHPVPQQTFRSLFAARTIIAAAVSRAYLRSVSGAATDRTRAVHAVAAALLAGRNPAVLARAGNIALAETYWVFAVRFSRPLGNRAEITHWWDLARAGLTEYSTAVLALAGLRGATVLVPVTDLSDADTGKAAAILSGALRQDSHIVVVHGEVARLPQAVRLAHELVAFTRQHRLPARLYCLADLVIEHQLARPGIALDLLAAAVAPLVSAPNLLDTLRIHLATDLNRRRTARELYVHVNTVDYRIKRIQELTGLDVRRPDDRFRLRAGLIAHDSNSIRHR